MSEGKQTQRDSKLMNFRKVTYQGKEAHVKWGNKSGKMLRIYFYIDRTSEKIVIGCIGEHLEITSSRNKHE